MLATANNQLYIYNLLKAALEQKSQEELNKLLSTAATTQSASGKNAAHGGAKEIRISVSLEDSTCESGLKVKAIESCIIDTPSLDAEAAHLSFQNSLSEDMARMLQHAC
jgi:hypothetical protein